MHLGGPLPGQGTTSLLPGTIERLNYGQDKLGSRHDHAMLGPGMILRTRRLLTGHQVPDVSRKSKVRQIHTQDRM